VWLCCPCCRALSCPVPPSPLLSAAVHVLPCPSCGASCLLCVSHRCLCRDTVPIAGSETVLGRSVLLDGACAEHSLTATGELDATTAQTLLDLYSDDGYTDSGEPASKSGHLYKVHIGVHRNRSVESTATLFDANNTVLLTFQVRTHGWDTVSSMRCYFAVVLLWE
jgi:hypothetical protein